MTGIKKFSFYHLLGPTLKVGERLQADWHSAILFLNNAKSDDIVLEVLTERASRAHKQIGKHFALKSEQCRRPMHDEQIIDLGYTVLLIFI